MGKPLILAEKPKQAMKYAEAIGSFTRKQGYIEFRSNTFFPNGAYLSWGIGHLVELVEPSRYQKEWGDWNKEALASFPISPKEFKFEVAKGKEEQFGVIETLLREVDEVIIATDCDREGENIAWSILKQANATNKTMKRLWINSLEEDAVREGFKNLRDGNDYYPMYLEAQTRQFSDWLVGMNLTKLYTIFLKEKGMQGTFSVGRVQTPTLYMVYEQEEKIRQFVSKPFFELNGLAEHTNGNFQMKTSVKSDSKEEIEKIIKSKNLAKVDTTITKLEEKQEKESAPKLYTMSGIQVKANKLWKYSPQRTLEIVQGLYEKKLLTYPRTDTPYITENEFSYLLANLEHYEDLLGQSLPIAFKEPRKGYVDASKVQEHYAIVPTKEKATKKTLDSLTKDEQNIYIEVIKNTVSMFCKDAIYAKTNIEIHVDDIVFKTSGKVEVDEGWKVLFAKDDTKKKSKETVLPLMKQGDPVILKGVMKEGKTTPPKRFTEGDLIPLMKNAGNQEEDEDKAILKETEGIGTEATRSNIIETLKKKEYINVDKNLVYCTPKGEILSKVVTGTLLASPKMTAGWERVLKKIGKGEPKQTMFLSKINEFIEHMIVEVPKLVSESDVSSFVVKQQEVDSVSKCPNCQGGLIREHKAFYGCSNFKNGCKQTFPKIQGHKKVSPTQMKKILEKGESDLIKGFANKDKTKTFDAKLLMKRASESEPFRLHYKFQEKKAKK